MVSLHDALLVPSTSMALIDVDEDRRQQNEEPWPVVPKTS
jgi:hypothetical protein